MDTFHLEILAADGAFFRGECMGVVVPTPNGRYGILAHHSNLIGAVVPGIVEFTAPDGLRRSALVEAGLVKVEHGSVLLLVDSAERPEDAEANCVHREAERKREEELQRRSIREYQAAQAALARAVRSIHGRNETDSVQ